MSCTIVGPGWGYGLEQGRQECCLPRVYILENRIHQSITDKQIKKNSKLINAMRKLTVQRDMERG